MYPTDFESFSGLLRQLSEVFAKKLTDEMVQAYWRSLKDQSLPSIQRLADQHTRTQKFFPKPYELRPREEKKLVRDEAAEAAFREGEARATADLEELGRLDPDAGKREVKLRKLDRLISITNESSPAYQQIRCEWLAARGIHVGEKEWAEVGVR